MIQIERISADGLHIENWEFQIFNFAKIVLDVYGEFQKKNKRHKNWERIAVYSRLYRGAYFNEIEESAVPLPQDVRNEVLEKFQAMIKIMTWSEYKKL